MLASGILSVQILTLRPPLPIPDVISKNVLFATTALVKVSMNNMKKVLIFKTCRLALSQKPKNNFNTCNDVQTVSKIVGFGW